MKAGRNEVIAACNLAKSGDLRGATRLLLEIRKQPELEAEAHYGLGLIELDRNNIQNAEAYFKKAIDIEPAHADSYYQLAKMADAHRDAVTARLYFRSVLAYEPGHVMATAALAAHGDAAGGQTCHRGSWRPSSPFRS